MAQHRLIPALLALCLATPALAASDAPAPSPTAAADQLLIKRNYKGAFEALRKAAEAGEAKAMVKLANAYRFGLGTPRDAALAQGWYEKAAAKGNREAAAYLAQTAIAVSSTEKKQASLAQAGQQRGSVDFTHLPDRPKAAPDWASLAAAQRNHAALAALGGADAGQVQLIQAALGDAEALKATPASTATDALGRTPVMLAVARGKPDALAALLAAHPDLSVQDKQGFTAAGLAARACDDAALAQLSAAGDDLQSGRLPPLVVAAASCEDWSKLKPVLAKVNANATDAAGRTAAHFAAMRGDIALLGWLADQGANLALADGEGFFPLHRAALSGQAQALRFLLDKTGKSAWNSKRNVTPLMLAANAGCVACIAALLDSKPDLDQKDADGDTALMFAVRALQGAAAQKLADSGANPNAKNNAGDTPLKLGLRLGLTQIKAAN